MDTEDTTTTTSTTTTPSVQVAEKKTSKKGAAKKKVNGSDDSAPKQTKPKSTTTKPRSSSKTSLNFQNKLKKIDWRDLTPIGFEVKTWDAMLEEDWEFDTLNRELKEGFLSNLDHPLYMFMGAQPIVGKTNKDSMNIPYIVVFDCLTPPPNKICKASIQSTHEDVYDMSAYKLEWTPYVRSKLVNFDFTKYKKPIQTLQWKTRSTKTSKMTEEQLIDLQFLLPYIRLPQVVEKITEPAPVTSVKFNMEFALKDPEEYHKQEKEKREKEREEAEKKAKEEEAEAEKSNKKKKTTTEKKKPGRVSKKAEELAKKKAEEQAEEEKKVKTHITLEINYDKQVDTPADFLESFEEDHPEIDFDPDELRAALKKEFERLRAIEQKRFDAIHKEVSDMSEKDKENLRNCKIYKFYPSHEDIDISRFVSKSVNRFFGNAHKVFPEEANLDISNLKELDAKAIEKEKKEAQKLKEQVEKEFKEHQKQHQEEKEKETTKSKKSTKKDKEEQEEQEEEKQDGDEEEEEEEDDDQEEKKNGKSTKRTKKEVTKTVKKQKK